MELLLARKLVLKKQILSELKTDQLFAQPWNERQWEFVNDDAQESMLSGINQQGKSTCLLNLAAWELTGIYPPEFTGPKLILPFKAMLLGDSAENARDILTDRLLGEDGERGTGVIPAFCIKKVRKKVGGVADQIEYFDIWHHHPETLQRNGYCRCYVRAYKQKNTGIRGYPNIKRIYCDEEPPYGVYEEMKARLRDRKTCRLIFAMTPEQGWSALLTEFYREGRGESKYKRFFDYGIQHCTHIDDEDEEFIRAKWKHSPMEAARLLGIPELGIGLLYRVPNSDIATDLVPHSSNLLWGIGLDFQHTTGKMAAVKMCLDTTAQRMFVVATYKSDKNELSAIHAEAVRAMGGALIPCFWPHDGGRQWKEGSSITVADRYKELGLNTWHESARTKDESNNTLTEVEEIIDWMVSGRFKVMLHLAEWYDEKTAWKQENGRIPDGQEDHLMDATVKAFMMRRFFKPAATRRGKAATGLQEFAKRRNFFQRNRR